MSAAGRRAHFVTLDFLGDRHTVDSLEGAYAAGAALAETGSEFLHAGLRSAAGTFTVATWRR